VLQEHPRLWPVLKRSLPEEVVAEGEVVVRGAAAAASTLSPTLLQLSVPQHWLQKKLEPAD